MYDPKNQCVHLYAWDDQGNRVKYELPFAPYLYVEDRYGSGTSIYGTKLKRRDFRSSFERNKFVKDSGIRRIFENIPPAQQYLIDQYWQLHERDDFVANPLSICLLDIETETRNVPGFKRVKYRVNGEEREDTLEFLRVNIIDCEVWEPSSETWVNFKTSSFQKTSFPNVDDAQHAINLITCYDSLKGKMYTFGTRPYTGTGKTVNYIYCRTERELFTKFLEWLEQDFPDVLSGWNSDFFDIPYIINRGEKVLGDDIKRISPLGHIRKRTFMGQHGKEQTKYHLDGVAVVDYLDVYKKFTMAKRESYKLDAIGDVELGMNKLDFGDMSLAELSEWHWDKFVDYNVHDVQLLISLEEKLKYINLLRMLSSAGLTTLEAAMGTVSVITGAMVCQARSQGEIIPTFQRGIDLGQNPGAYVAEPRKGFNEYVFSFDANSLYPNTMITLNASPETKMGKVVVEGDEVFVKHISGKSKTLSRADFVKWMKMENLTLSKAGVLFSQKKRGIMPEWVDIQYKKRKIVQKELAAVNQRIYDIETSLKAGVKGSTKKLEDELKELKITRQNLNTKQHCIKIQINSCYGYTGNKQAALGDDDIASSITLTGQAIIKESNEIVKRFIKARVPDATAQEMDSVIVYNDTDSVYISIKPLVDRGLVFSNGSILTKECHKVAEEITNDLNSYIAAWSNRTLNTNDSRIIFKRECICDMGLFLKKKRYVLHVLDAEGIPCSKYKYVGVDVVRTNMPNTIKPYAKRIIEVMMETKCLDQTTKILNETYEVFCGLDPAEIASVMGIKKYEFYANQCDDMTLVKKMPHNVKSSYFYNLILKKLGIDNKYEALGSGDKVRYIHVDKNNKYGIKTIGFKYIWPVEFNQIFQVDKSKMFEKIMFKSIERFYFAVGWSVRKPWEAVNAEFSDIFG